MRRWKIGIAITALLAVIPLAGCISQHTEGLGEYWAPSPGDEGATFEPNTHMYNAPKGNFDVKIPGAPVHNREYQITTTNARQRVKYETPNLTCVIATVKIPNTMVWEPKNLKRLKQSEILMMKNDIQALPTPTKTYPVSSDDGTYFGTHVEGTTRDGKYYRIRNYLDKNLQISYRMICVGSKDEVNSADANEFFNTFKIIK